MKDQTQSMDLSAQSDVKTKITKVKWTRSKDLLESSITTCHRLLILMRISIQILREVLNGLKKTLKQRSMNQNTIETPTGILTRTRLINLLIRMRSHMIEVQNIPLAQTMKTRSWERWGARRLLKTFTVSVTQTDSLVSSVIKAIMKFMVTKVEKVLIRTSQDYLRIWLALLMKKSKSVIKKKRTWLTACIDVTQMIWLARRATAVLLLIRMTPHIKTGHQENRKTNTTEVNHLNFQAQKTGGIT